MQLLCRVSSVVAWSVPCLLYLTTVGVHATIFASVRPKGTRKETEIIVKKEKGTKGMQRKGWGVVIDGGGLSVEGW